MQEKCERIKDEFTRIGDAEPITVLVKIAQDIAGIALATFRDDLLVKALKISKAIVDFDCELRYGGQK